MDKTFEQLLKENRELMDLIVGKLAAVNVKFSLLRRVFDLKSDPSLTPHEQSACARGEAETLREGFALVNEVLEKVVDHNRYTENDVYTLMQKYKGG